MSAPVTRQSVLHTSVLSHGTLEVVDLQSSRRFYEEVLGLNVRQLTPVSLHVDLGDGYMYAAVHSPKSQRNTPMYQRNTLLFASPGDVHEARVRLEEVRAEYDIMEITDVERSVDRYFFRVRDQDGNWWELAFDARGGYHRWFDKQAN
jgi:catechol 2,3-dioxygenase-like lactoylglutathione lyase family enzyme